MPLFRLAVPLVTVLALAACNPLPPKDRPAAGPSTQPAVLDQSLAPVTPRANPPIPPSAPGAAPAAATASELPVGVTDLPVGVTDDGWPYRGRADAPVTVTEFSDYQCPFCARYVADTQSTLLARYAATGKVKFVFRDYPIPSLHPAAMAAAQHASCVLAQDPSLYWLLHDRLFETQDQWSRAAAPADAVAELAVGLGADRGALSACLAAGRVQPAIDASVQAAKGLGFDGTPSFRIVSDATNLTYDIEGAQPAARFVQVIDAALAGVPFSEPTATVPPLPAWASAEGLAADPKRPGLTQSGAPYRGRDDAPVTVVEFVDYQCAPCNKYTVEVQPAVDKALVETGAVRWVVKNLPMPEHPQALAAAAAAVCAADQGRFWEMHDALFRTVARWAVDPPDPALIRLADETGLDGTAFRACFSGRAAAEAVIRDLHASRDVTTSVPTFVVVFGGQGTVLRGAHSAESFVEALAKLVDMARGTPKP